jgi:serine/threonine protein kinase
MYDRQPYSIKTDVWSLGIIFYEVLVGWTPDRFLAPNIEKDTFPLVNSETLFFPPSAPKISEPMKELIRSMLRNEEE